MTTQAAVLRSTDGDEVPLRGVTATGRLEGLLFELAVEQVYENNGTDNIEAEYTFPVPHRAVLLGLELQIGERALQAVAVRRQAARKNYEQAIDEGNSAALLEQAGDGLWSLSLGNLLAGERAVIRYRYAELLDRAGDEVRLSVPTVIAPRYGNPADSGLQPHQVPGVNLLAEYPLALAIDIRGAMARALLTSPSHIVSLTAIDGGQRVSLAPGAFLDRDFVLRLSGPVTRSAGLVALDGQGEGAGYTALLSLDPGITEEAGAPLALKLVVDCSGSMGGTSIECARRALKSVLVRLTPADRVSLTRFGSTVEHATPGLVAAEGGALAKLSHDVRELQADLGGTEMDGALRAAVKIPTGKATVKDILLITDAEVWSVDSMVEEVAKSGHRLFVVAVGSAPVEALSRKLADRTGGACEFVSPAEDAEAAIVRTFRRLREAPKRVAAVRWPVVPVWTLPLPAAVFSGDTLHLLAGFASAPVGEVTVTVTGARAGNIVLKGQLGAAGSDAVLPRLAAERRLPHLEEEEATALAERYQLPSAYTSFVVVQVREGAEKATALPKLAAVPQMLAAGWGATGAAERSLMCESLSVPGDYSEFARPVPNARASRHAPTLCRDESLPSVRMLGASVAAGSADSSSHSTAPPLDVLHAIAARLRANPDERFWIEDLGDLGVDVDALRALGAAIDAGSASESDAVRCWIAELAASPAGASLSAEDRALLEGGVAGDRSLREARAAVRGLLARVSPAAWQGEPEMASAGGLPGL